MDKETIAKQVYPDVEGYLDQVEHDRIQFIKGFEYATKHLTEQLALKDTAYSDLGNKYSHLLEQLAEANGCIERQARIYHEQVGQLAEKEKEIEKYRIAMSEILELFDGIGTPNINWIQSKLSETLNPNK